MENCDEIRDIGKDMPYSMKDGQIMKYKSQFVFFGVITFLNQYNYHLKTSPRNAIINSVLFTLSKSKNPYLNALIRIPSKLLIYGASIFIGQLLARQYWIYKRSFNAMKKAVLDTYVNLKIYSNDEEYKESYAFDEIRPKLVS
ncbi:UNKNOWN [Stylonychia lemnae]|uniref:Uncharacterized protein n=1 Tax=Stylonychia lemnae TaxID=5949 RepID=A0A078AE37_STYLE|nr:UNKNOWN [Stylonychia lemnae]CDW89836.1 UNKNOWN [Stylonychia lemnae]|eukprot:CDW79178.1 UNKNOWN [Stylonychia lemnae]